MRTRGTLLLAAVALLLGGYVYWFEIRGSEKRAEAEAAARVIFSIDPDAATGLELETSDGRSVVLVRSGESADAAVWRLTSPLDYPADGDAVLRALEVLEKLASTATIDARPVDLEPFGLGAGRKRIAVKPGEGEARVLHLGGSTPVGGGRYVELANDPNRLFVVSAGSIGGLTPSLVELRDKRILRVAPGTVDDLTVRAGGTLVVRAKKSESGWAIVEPESAPGDEEKIRRVLDDLALARASGFEDAPKEKESYGLASPGLEVVARAGALEERLAVAQADGRTWLERANDPVVLEVNERVLSNVPRELFDYREKRVLRLDVEQIRAVELAFPREDKTQRLKRDGETWSSDEAGLELLPTKVEDLLYAISALDATGLESTTPDRAQIGLDPALAIVRAYDEKGTLLGDLSVGDPDPVKGLPALSSQSPLVWRVSNDLGREVPLSAEAFRNLLVKAPPAAPAPADPNAPTSP